jgi:predicted nuclease of predicted toxin-antitoxin system
VTAIRFHLDESVSPAIADGLRRRGIDVTASRDVGLLGASDETQLSFAVAAGRVIFTQDDDFLAMAKQGAEHCGIVYCHQHARTIGQILGGLLLIADCLTAEEMRNHLEFL